MSQSRHLIEEESQVGEARRQASLLAQLHGLDPVTIGRVAIASTELASNLLRHGGGGELLIQPVRHGASVLIELIAIDRGKGMENVERSITDGYSTAGTAGTGLGAVRRLALEFDIYSVAGEGSVVLARIGGQARTSAPSPERSAVRFGAVSLAVAGETECGDTWRVATQEGNTAVMVADGLGHGTFAAQAAHSAATAFESAPFESPGVLLERLHRATAGSRGAAAACAQVGADGQVRYAGVGNISGHLVSAERSQGMVSHGGTLGLKVSRMQQFEYRRAPNSLVIMHSDGVSARWDLKSKPGLLQRHPAVIAALLYRDHGRSRDDATVVVLR
jgi:anti-sigma regulatory factor (Ser/Thr protein kinase)